jgi:hypothetical protein
VHQPSASASKDRRAEKVLAPHHGERGGLGEDCVKLEASIANVLWKKLRRAGELDGLVYRFRALRNAATCARQRSWQPSPTDRLAARTEIVEAHGYATWEELHAALGSAKDLWAWIESHLNELALAKRVRAELLSVPVGGVE